MIKAMILAAGRGERMRPLTDVTPKPLLKIGNRSLIERHLVALQAVGVRDVVINIHHFAEQIRNALGDGSAYGVNIHYSVENILLETGGGICQALPLLGQDAFIYIAADIVTDYPLMKLKQLAMERADDQRGWGHLVMVDNPGFHPDGDFGITKSGGLTLQAPKLTFGCLGLLHPRLFKDCQEKMFSLGGLLKKKIAENLISGEHFHGMWHNLGTVEQLEALRSASLNELLE